MTHCGGLVFTDNKANFDQLIEGHLTAIFAELSGKFPELQSHWNLMAEAMMYPVSAGGKRVRPQLVKLTAETLGAPENHPAVLKAGCAIELIHTYSLVHDDLPCMDDDDLRRGKPTPHKVYGEARAVLMGDALQTEAFGLLLTLQEDGVPAECVLKCLEQLIHASGLRGMISGQWLDLTFESELGAANWPILSSIHNLKTGALLSAALSMGTILGCTLAPTTTTIKTSQQTFTIEDIHSAQNIGQQLGLAFQLIDDVLDVSQPSQQLGKTAGKDAAQGKLTAVSLLGLPRAKDVAQQLTHDCRKSLDALLAGVSSRCHSTISAEKSKELHHLIGDLLNRTS